MYWCAGERIVFLVLRGAVARRRAVCHVFEEVG
jgi:hypothetical protein